jgi:hypothetical protein
MKMKTGPVSGPPGGVGMEAMVKDGENDAAPRSADGFRSVVGVGCGLALGALAGIVVGSVAGVGLAMILRLL